MIAASILDLKAVSTGIRTSASPCALLIRSVFSCDPCPTALIQRKQIHEDDRGNATNGFQPTSGAGMRFKPLQRRAYWASDPPDPIHSERVALAMSICHPS